MSATKHAQVDALAWIDVADLRVVDLLRLAHVLVWRDELHRDEAMASDDVEVASVLDYVCDQSARARVSRRQLDVMVDPLAGTDLAVVLCVQLHVRLDLIDHKPEAAGLSRAHDREEGRARVEVVHVDRHRVHTVHGTLGAVLALAPVERVETLVQLQLERSRTRPAPGTQVLDFNQIVVVIVRLVQRQAEVHVLVSRARAVLEVHRVDRGHAGDAVAQVAVELVALGR